MCSCRRLPQVTGTADRRSRPACRRPTSGKELQQISSLQVFRPGRFRDEFYYHHDRRSRKDADTTNRKDSQFMMKKYLFFFVFVSLVTASAAHATVDLIAIGSVSGAYEDLASKTAAALENGVPGNTLGGVGSGIAYAGGNTFLALPDRGPNAVVYNSS